MKYGFVWVFDRVTGENLFPVQEVSAFPSTIPGEKLATRQTLPAAPEPFARQRLTEETLTQRTPAANAAVRAHLATLSNRGRFDPPSLEGTVIFPGLDGGGEYGGAAWDPETGILYINSNEQAYILQLRRRSRRPAARPLLPRSTAPPAPVATASTVRATPRRSRVAWTDQADGEPADRTNDCPWIGEDAWI